MIKCIIIAINPFHEIGTYFTVYRFTFPFGAALYSILPSKHWG